MCLGSACYKQCKYKLDNSAADLRVGDLWGSRYQDNEQGVSALIPFTERGQNIVEILQGCHISEISFETAAEGQTPDNPAIMITSCRCCETRKFRSDK